MQRNWERYEHIKIDKLKERERERESWADQNRLIVINKLIVRKKERNSLIDRNRQRATEKWVDW